MTLLLRMALVALIGCAHSLPAFSGDLATDRELMVRNQVVSRGVSDQRVLAAMRKVPREAFIPESLRSLSYADQPLPIGSGQTISQPFMVAFMTEKLQLKQTDRVLEIGTGSGYEAAILGELAAQVYTIEIVESLGRKAAEILQKLGYKNVKVKIGDGYQGWPEQAPFDAVIVTCAPEKIPQPLVQQTKEGGRMIIPVGRLPAQELYLLEKKAGRLEQRAILPVLFVPMTGEAQTEKPMTPQPATTTAP